jgi:hypothetical protein
VTRPRGPSRQPSQLLAFGPLAGVLHQLTKGDSLTPQAGELWTAAGVLLGFQVTAFLMRLGREIAAGDEDMVTWMPPSDVLNLGSMVVTAIGVFILPLVGWVTLDTSARLFGLALLLFVGYPFALAGHYDTYNQKPRTGVYCTRQEKVAIAVVAAVVLLYCGVAFLR